MQLKRAGELPISLEGYEHAEWVLADYGDFLVHIFSPKSREYYDLERLWGDAPSEHVEDDGSPVAMLQAWSTNPMPLKVSANRFKFRRKQVRTRQWDAQIDHRFGKIIDLIIMRLIRGDLLSVLLFFNEAFHGDSVFRRPDVGEPNANCL
jgi:hypothetical protein